MLFVFCVLASTVAAAKNWAEDFVQYSTSLALSFDSVKGYGYLATKDIEEGEVVFQIPYDLVLVGPLPFALSVYIEDLDPNLQLMARLLYEKYVESQNTFHRQYVQGLPEEIPIPDLWSPADREFIEDLGLFSGTSLVSDLQNEHQLLNLRLEGKVPDEFLAYSSLKWAHAILRTRGFTVNLDELRQFMPELVRTNVTKATMLVPFVDNTNHAPRLNSSSRAMQYSPTTLNLVADRPTKKGSEFVFEYSSKLCTRHLLRNYGFTLMNNPKDYFILKFNSTQCYEETVDGTCAYKLTSRSLNKNLLDFFVKAGRLSLLKAALAYREYVTAEIDKAKSVRALRRLDVIGNRRIAVDATLALLQTRYIQLKLIDRLICLSLLKDMTA